MTCIAVLRGDNGTVWMGSDSCAVRNSTKQTLGQPKVFRLGDVYVGRTGVAWAGEVVRRSFDPGEAPHEREEVRNWVFNHLVPGMTARLKEVGAWAEDRDEDGDVRGSEGGWILVVRGLVFEVATAGQVFEVAGPYHAIGNGEDPALGVLYALTQVDGLLGLLSPYDCLKVALRAAFKHREGVAPPFHIIECRNLPPSDAGVTYHVQAVQPVP
jgi:hypothetical protein